MNDNQARLLEEIKAKGRFLTDEEVVEFYNEHVRRRLCRFGFLQAPSQYKEQTYREVYDLARAFYLRAIGVLCEDGELSVCYKCDESLETYAQYISVGTMFIPDRR